MKLASVPLLLLALTASAAIAAEEKPVPAAGVTATPAKPVETTEPKVYAPTDLATLRPLKGQKIAVEGTIASSGANRTDSIRYLNFTKNYRESVSLVFFGNAASKEKLAEYVGKKVRATGTLGDHNDALQIKVEKLDQIKVIEEPAPAPAPAAPPASAPAK